MVQLLNITLLLHAHFMLVLMPIGLTLTQVEGEQNKFGCFYLSESLNENLDYVFLPRTDDEKIESYDPAQALAEFHGHPHSM